MEQRFIKNFALLISKDNSAQIVSRCTTFTDCEIVERATEPECLLYAIDNKIELPEFEKYK